MLQQETRSYHFLPILWLLAALGIFSTSLSLPSMPAISKALNASDNAVQLSLAVLFLGSACGNLLLGPLADKKGRLIVAKLGLVIFILASFWCAEASSVTSLILARFFQGCGASCGMLVTRAMGRDLFEGIDLTRYSSTLMMVISISPAIAPTMGGFIESYLGWQMNFYVLVLFGILVAVLVWIWVPETKTSGYVSTQLSQTFKNYGSLFKSSLFGLSCLVLGTQMTAIFLYATLSPYFFINLFGWSPSEYGLLGIAGAFGNIVGFALSRRLAHRLKFEKGILIGSLLCFFATFVFIGITLFFSPNAYVLILYSIFFYGFSALCTVNASTAALNLYPEKAGIAAAMIGAIQIGSGFFGGSIASLLPTSLPLFGITMGTLYVVSLVGGIYVWLGR